MEEFPCAMLAKGPACTKTGVPWYEEVSKRKEKEGETHLESLHQVWFDSVFHEHCQCSSNTNIIRGDRLSTTAGSYDHSSEPSTYS